MNGGTTRLGYFALSASLLFAAVWIGRTHSPMKAAADSPAYSRPVCNRVAATNPAKAAALCPAGSPVSPLTQPNPAPTSSPADQCGTWSDPTVSGSTGAIIQAAYGEPRNCLKVGDSWVITTLGTQGKPGAVGVYHCSDAACLDGQTAHGFSGWTFVHSPRSGGAIVLGIDPRYKDTLFIDDAGSQMDFNVDTATFSVDGTPTR